MAITVLSRDENVIGNYREIYLHLNIGVTGDSYVENSMHIVKGISYDNTLAISKALPSVNSATGFKNVITFTTTGAVTDVRVRVVGK